MVDKDAYFEKLVNTIKDFGYHITFVYPTKDDKDKSFFCYSTGIYETYGMPELIISSLPQGLSSQIMENYISLFKNSQEIPTNQKLAGLWEQFPVYLIETLNSELAEYVLSSFWYYKEREFKYFQVIFPDTQGYFPNENGYSYDQEILGNFPKF